MIQDNIGKSKTGCFQLTLSEDNEFEDELIDQVNYQNMSFSVWKDIQNSLFYTVIAGKRVNICSTDTSYRHMLMDTIDEYLNLIEEFYSNFKLVWFKNGTHEDIKLLHNHRTIFIYLVDDKNKIDIDAIIKDASIKSKNYLTKCIYK